MIRMTTSRRIGWARYAERIGKENEKKKHAYNLLVGKPEMTKRRFYTYMEG
jgi:hypothetical protein